MCFQSTISTGLTPHVFTREANIAPALETWREGVKREVCGREAYGKSTLCVRWHHCSCQFCQVNVFESSFQFLYSLFNTMFVLVFSHGRRFVVSIHQGYAVLHVPDDEQQNLRHVWVQYRRLAQRVTPPHTQQRLHDRHSLQCRWSGKVDPGLIFIWWLIINCLIINCLIINN